jgi:molybdenum-dependent DNA-binding transcriptional regulator ModE
MDRRRGAARDGARVTHAFETTMMLFREMKSEIQRNFSIFFGLKIEPFSP